DFLSKIEPKKVSEALKHPGWIDAMQEELNPFYRNKVWTRIPLPYGKIAIVDKSLYGLKQAPRAWYKTLSTFLIQNKFTRGRIDNTLFIYKSKGDVLLVQVYVDDIIFGSTSYTLCKQFEKLMTKKFKMNMIGELTYFLGLQIKQDDKGISICQEQYTRNLLKKYKISDSSSVKTPMVPPNNLGPDLAGKPVNETSYRGMIGSLMYLKDTSTLGLYYPKCSGFDLKGYSDSDYAGCNMDRKSTSGACQILGGKLVCGSAKKQQLVVMSSTETEYVVAAGCCCHCNIQQPSPSLKNQAY
ncbi:retrovirus-related pol polyprotein from transposon TNT 1-94, partial [Tanacetum coccineum]